MKSVPTVLYDADERYTDLALKIDLEVIKALEPIMMKYAREGVPVRALAGLMHSSVQEVELSAMFAKNDLT